MIGVLHGMDNYPAHLAPEFDEGGGVETPFELWWPRVRESFPTVPEDAAKHWLYEHWKHSPYKFLASRNYTFTSLDWPLDRLSEILSCLCDYQPSQAECIQHGRHLLTLDQYPTTCFMAEHCLPPARLIMLDNRDDHLQREYQEARWPLIPPGYILIEGHRRFNLCLALHEQRRLKRAPFWLMSRT